MAARRPPRGLGPEDLALWQSVARSARPLHSAPLQRDAPAEIVSPTHAGKAGPKPPALDQARLEAPPQQVRKASAPRTSTDLRPDIAEHLASAPLRMDRKRFVALSRGKADPEARLDLHGMTLAQAHAALNGFVLRAHAQGQRLVLVITGKGASEPGASEAYFALRPRGALRQQVPHWLASAPLSGVVLQITPAHRRHGGAGAYYVYLRRHRSQAERG